MNSIRIDQDHIWHPYSAMSSDAPVYQVASADGVRLKLSDGRELIDGMASWWCVIHGYNHPVMNAAIEAQQHKMSHVMFGGLTHEPAIELTRQLIEITPEPLQCVFFSDSGSVAVEVAMKMAIQYWHAKGEPQRKRFIALRGAYHGDTFAAMSVSDPETGMHDLFKTVLSEQVFVERPESRYGQVCSDKDLARLEQAFVDGADQIAALIMEPVVQGAGGMWFFSADYLAEARELCDKYGVLLILDEIATGFGRTGKLFASEHAAIVPDILCIGKAMTSGYLTLAATMTTKVVSDAIDAGEPGVFMHGPTFMANPLACAAANASIRLLLESDWQESVARIERGLTDGLACCRDYDRGAEVRVLGAIGVVEMKRSVDMKTMIQSFVDAGVWVRPFGKLVYLMPPFVISDQDLSTLCKAVAEIVSV